jgi:hypothetical protein
MATTYIVDKDGNQIDAASATVPSDRHFRGAWSNSRQLGIHLCWVTALTHKDK